MPDEIIDSGGGDAALDTSTDSTQNTTGPGAGATSIPQSPGAGASPAKAGGRARGKAKAAKPVEEKLDPNATMTDVARETAEKLLLEEAGADDELDDDALQMADAAGPQGQEFDPARSLAELAKIPGLPPAAAQAIAAQAAQWEQYQGQVNQVIAQIGERRAQLEEREATAMRVLSHPAIKPHVDALMSGGTPPQSHGNNGQRATGRPPLRIAPDQLADMDETSQALYGEIQAMREELAQRDQREAARQRAEAEDHAEQVKTSVRSEISEAHKTLDKQYPELARDPAKYTQWHKLAARLYDRETGMAQALADAAIILTKDKIEARGAAAATAAGRKAARSATIPEGRRGQMDLADGPDGDMADIAAELRAAM